MTTNPPQQASNFEAIYWPNASCGVYDGTADCHQPGVVLGYDTFSPEIGIWFCSEHWPEFAHMITIVEDKRRYKVSGFSPGLVGVWDKRAEDFVKNPGSGRRKLFRHRENAEKLADKLNKEEDKRTKETTNEH